MKETTKAKGYITWEKYNVRTGEITGGGETCNTINIGYKQGIRDMLKTGSSVGQVDKIEAGTTNTAFTETSTSLGSILINADREGTDIILENGITDKELKVTFGFGYSEIGFNTIEELAMYAGSTIIAMSSGISETLTTQYEAIRVTWTLTIN